MSLSDPRALFTAAPRSPEPPSDGAPPCRQCGRPMRVLLATPLQFAGGGHEITFGCMACGLETKRIARRD